jgi:hypothetical protein
VRGTWKYPVAYGDTVKLLVLAAVPPGAVTAIGPVVAPTGTDAVIFVDELTTNVAAVPLKLTAVVPVKFRPLMVTDEATRPLVGEKLVITGATVKVPTLVAVPAGVCTLMVPVVTPDGTTAEICTLESTVNAASLPLNFTDDVSMKLAPLIVTVIPDGPLVGENEVIVGNGLKLELAAAPAGVVTVILPVVASTGTVAVICIAELTVKVAFATSKTTAVVPRRLLPVNTTLVPAGPLVGESPVIFGKGMKGKLLLAVPPGVVTAIFPVVASAGTFALI